MSKINHIKISDLRFAVDEYQNIFNSIVNEIASIIENNCNENLNMLSLKPTLIKRKGTIQFTFKYYDRYRELYYRGFESKVIKLINIHGSYDLKNKIAFINACKLYPFNKFNYIYKEKTIRLTTELSCKQLKKWENTLIYSIKNTTDDLGILSSEIGNEYIGLKKKEFNIYNNVIENLKSLMEEKNFFNEDGSINTIYKNIELDDSNIKNINFDNKNISGINISKCKNIHINFDKIQKDLTSTNISGYDLSNYTFRNFNLSNSNLTNTKATIDLASCIITTESKINEGTIFDEDNKFVIGEHQLDKETVKKLNLTIKKS